jgi:pimeloyl-ACP methyl ester carboxylesterase
MRRGVGRGGGVLVAAIAMATLGMVTLGATVAAPAPATAVPVIEWQACDAPSQSGFECATAKVPLDYRDPEGSTIDLALVRHPATDPTRRIGTLFFNPGGPGGAGTQFLPAWLDLFPAMLRERFDLISWDPRGIGESTSVQCFATPEEGLKFLADLPVGFPVGRVEIDTWIRGYARFAQLCAERNGDLLERASTADSARDLDLLRQAVGEPRMNFLGVSYGTFLGATYANLFPDRVRALVLDGNVDPIAWVNRGNEHPFLNTGLRLESDTATARTLKAFLNLCGEAGIERCAFSAGSASSTRAKFSTLLWRLRRHPVPFEGEPLTYAFVVSLVADFLVAVQPVSGFPGWAFTAELLQTLWTGGSGGSPAPRSYPFPEQRLAVECGESPNPQPPEIFRALAAFAYARAGHVGLFWSWFDEPCASWPAVAANPYTGPWDRRTANPVLVIGNTFDPQNPLQGSVAMARALARARLLTVDGYGHTALINLSSCANRYMSEYFVDGTLPPEGTVCRQDQEPFAAAPPAR